MRAFESGVLRRPQGDFDWRNCTAQACCVKCRAKREMKNPQSITTKNGRHAMKGTCPVCGTSLFRIGG